MKKLLFILSFCLICVQCLTYAGIIGTTRWVKGNKTICIYFDNHCAGTPKQNAQHFDQIRQTVIDKTEVRTQPLLILVENYMREPQYRALARNLEIVNDGQQKLLQRFDEWVGRDLPNSIFIKSFDARVVPFLTFALFCEWQKRSNQRSKLPDQLYAQLDAEFATLTFGNVFMRANAIDSYIVQSESDPKLQHIFSQQKQVMVELIEDAKGILLGGGFSNEEINNKPIKSIWTELVTLPLDHPKRQAWMELFIDYRGQDFWTIDLLWQLTNANMLWEAVMFNGNVAIFTGSYHAVAMEECLIRLGYRQTGIAKREQVETERRIFKEEQEDKGTGTDLISFQSYAWMQ